jgi:hypothetical protein
VDRTNESGIEMKTSLPRRVAVAALSASLLVGLLPETGWAGRTTKNSATIDDVTKAEGDAGTSAFVFTVKLSQTPSSTVGLKYATAPGSAVAGADYVTTSGSLAFAPGVTQRTVEVLVKGDLDVEPDETFSLNLSGGGKAIRIADPQGLATIANDDQGPAISIGDVAVTEGDSGTHNAVFGVSLSHTSTSPVTVVYSSMDDTATAGLDYTAVNGTVTIAAGDASEPVAVPIIGDAVDEHDESVIVSLSNSSSNAWISDGQASGAILDDDAAPKVTINDVVVTEPASGDTTARFTASLSAASAKTVVVDYATADGTTNPATPGVDYEAAAGQLTFNAGDRVQYADVVVHGDGVDEADETFTVSLSNPVEAVLGSKASGIATIGDDDPTPSVSIGDAVVDEGNDGSVEAVLPVTLSAAAAEAVTVNYSTESGSASAGSDYDEVGSGTLTFPAGERTRQISVVVHGDKADEIDETFSVNLHSVSSAATAGRASAQVTIVDDDKAATASTVAIRKLRSRVVVRGRVTPAVPGQRMVVKLYKKRAGKWLLVATKRPMLSAARDPDGDGVSYSSYLSRFTRPRRARYFKVVATYLGDAEHLGSRAVKRFRYR